MSAAERFFDTNILLYALSVYDAMIAAAALLAGCNILVTEDMQHGQIFEGQLKVRNPFR